MSETIITQYTDTLSTIKSAGFIDDDDITFLQDNISTVQENWQKQQVFRTETEMNVSVLDNLHFPTYASKYWQCIRESGVMYQELVRGSFEYRRNEVEIKKLERQLASAAIRDKFERKLLEIDLEEKLFSRLNQEQQLKDRMREIKMWHNKMEEIKSQSDFDTEDVNTHQLVSYALRFQRQIELMQQNPGGMSQGEVDNLIGQFQTVREKLEDVGLLSEQHPDFVANQTLTTEQRNEIRKEAMTARQLALVSTSAQ